MNIFILDADPKLAAMYHCDKHVVKMCLESAQMLFTASRMMGFRTEGYKSTHVTHPCTLWAARNSGNWSWLYHLALHLGDEFTHRYGGVHKSIQALEQLPEHLQYEALNSEPFLLNPAQAMPDHCKHPDPVQAYRTYYLLEKRAFATWTNRPIPPWWTHE